MSRCRPLPIESWQKIASYMSIRDWAKVSGSCRSTSHMPLMKIQLTGLDEVRIKYIPVQGTNHY